MFNYNADDSSPDHSNNWLGDDVKSTRSKLLITAISLMALVAFVETIRCLRNKRTTDSTPSHLPDSLPQYSTQGPQLNLNSGMGLDECKIKFCTESIVLGESPVIPGPDSNVTCSICLEGNEVGDTVRRIRKCAHCFHAHCIELWLMKNNTCPVCRTILLAF